VSAYLDGQELPVSHAVSAVLYPRAEGAAVACAPLDAAYLRHPHDVGVRQQHAQPHHHVLPVERHVLQGLLHTMLSEHHKCLERRGRGGRHVPTL